MQGSYTVVRAIRAVVVCRPWNSFPLLHMTATCLKPPLVLVRFKIAYRANAMSVVPKDSMSLWSFRDYLYQLLIRWQCWSGPLSPE